MSCVNLSVSTVRCPRCDSDALYKYGRTRLGRQRFCCMMCNRQFVSPSSRQETKESPVCGSCGRRMHVYRRYNDFLRFRCSGYPECKTYLKIEWR